MKILFSQNINGISGSELYLLQIMPELKARGYDVEMLLIYSSTQNNNVVFTNQLKELGISFYEIYGHNPLSPVLLYKIYRLIQKGGYDIIQSNLIHSDMWMALIKIFFKPKLKIISVVHTYYPAYQAKYGYDFRYLKRDAYYWIQRFTCAVGNFTVTISKGLYNVYVDGGITRPGKIRNIHYGLTLKDGTVTTYQQIQPAYPYVLITGRLVAFKGHKYLIDAWQQVNAKHPELKLHIAGDGELRSVLENQVASLGLQQSVIFLGHVPNPHPIMEQCLFTLVTSTWEGFGLIMLESWLHKKPIIGFNAPAMNEVIDDGVNGLLVEPKNTAQLAAKINHLFENPQLAKQLGNAGYNKLISYFTLKRMTDEMEEVYHVIAAC